MPDIYDQHMTHFARVSAYVILRNGERVATIAFRFPADGAGRLYAYVHWLGVPMVRGFAGGFGYDKRSAAVENALPRMRMVDDFEARMYQEQFIGGLRVDNGHYWNRRLEDAGFTVLQAV
jgi:hypothetical protein